MVETELGTGQWQSFVSHKPWHHLQQTFFQAFSLLLCLALWLDKGSCHRGIPTRYGRKGSQRSRYAQFPKAKQTRPHGPVRVFW